MASAPAYARAQQEVPGASTLGSSREASKHACAPSRELSHAYAYMHARVLQVMLDVRGPPSIVAQQSWRACSSGAPGPSWAPAAPSASRPLRRALPHRPPRRQTARKQASAPPAAHNMQAGFDRKIVPLEKAAVARACTVACPAPSMQMQAGGMGALLGFPRRSGAFLKT